MVSVFTLKGKKWQTVSSKIQVNCRIYLNKKKFRFLYSVFLFIHLFFLLCITVSYSTLTPKSQLFQIFTRLIFIRKFPAVKINRKNFNELTVSWPPIEVKNCLILSHEQNVTIAWNTTSHRGKSRVLQSQLTMKSSWKHTHTERYVFCQAIQRNYIIDMHI